MTKKLEKRVNGCYTRMLILALAFSWRDHICNKDLYGNLPAITSKIRTRRLRLVGHLKRHQEEVGHHLVMWSPHQGHRTRGKPAMTFVQQLERDTGLSINEMGAQMMDRDFWRIMIGRGTPAPT